MGHTSRQSLADRKWPFGRETQICAACHGTGSDKQKVLDYVLSRVPPDRITMQVECDACEGRGRVLLPEMKSVAS